MPTPLETLQDATQRFRNAAPQLFEAFKAAFDVYTAEAAKNLVNATTNLKQLQGQLQQCHKLREMLEKIK